MTGINNKFNEMMINSYPGIFITFEGIDGSGKSTQLKRLCESLKERNYDIIETREPYKNIELKNKRDLQPIERQEFFIQDSALHLEEKIIPALKAGKHVFCDRFRDSGFAYWMSEGGDMKIIINSHERIMGANFILPNCTFFINTPADVAIKRLEQSKRGTIGYFETQERLEKVYNAYLFLYSGNTFAGLNRRIEFIEDDGKRSIDDIAKEILQKTLPILS